MVECLPTALIFPVLCLKSISILSMQLMLAGMHYNLSVLRRSGWSPWMRLMDHKKLELWRAADWGRRRCLRVALRLWWAPVEAALAQEWEQTQAATRLCEVS